MDVSIVITVFNEGKTIASLLDSLVNQTLKPDQIMVIDGGSTDNTAEIVRHYEKKYRPVKLFVEKCSRARGRNIGVEMAKFEIIAMTDAGCIADKNWLKEITMPFKNEEVDIVAGFYSMVGETPFQKAETIFLGVMPSKFDIKFLPSTRSIAFRKKVWEKIGGFPESKLNSAEDTDFNYKAVKLGVKYAHRKNARVEWEMPISLKEFFNKIFDYAKWDARYGIWWHPVQMFASHNIKVLFVYLRYVIGLILFFKAISNPSLFIILAILVLAYICWAFRKVYIETRNVNSGLWGIVLQFTTDIAVMWGFIKGVIR
jgi:glycosyltransferase involved in cell wall biosynthesis